MTDIHLLLRNGPSINAIHRKIIFSIAQYMLEKNFKGMTFDITGSTPATATLTTDFEIGRSASKEGILFRGHIEHKDNPTEIIFIAERIPNWCNNYIEEAPWPKPHDDWKN